MKNKNHKIVLIIIVALLFLSLGGCNSQGSPEDAVDNFFNYAKSFKLNSITNTFDDLDNDSEEMFEEISEGNDFPDYLKEYLKENAKKIEYKILNTEKENNAALVTVEVKYVDGGGVIRESFGEVFRTILSESSGGEDLSDEYLDNLFEETMKEKQRVNKEEILEKEIKINLIQSRGKWYIKEMTDNLADIVMSGFIKAMGDMGSNVN